MVVMDMVMVMARGLLMLSQDMAMVMDMELVLSMLPATPTEAHRDSMDTMVFMDMVVMDMVMVMARDLQMLVTMVVLALMSTRPVLTTMDLPDMVSTTTARGQLMLDILVMEVMEDM